MKYMLLIYNNPEMLEALPKDEMDAIMNQVGVIMQELTESGEWLGGEGLAHPSQTRTVRASAASTSASPPTHSPLAASSAMRASTSPNSAERSSSVHDS